MLACLKKPEDCKAPGKIATKGDGLESGRKQAKVAARSQKSAPPIAFQIFCLKYPADCKKSKTTVVTFSKATLKKLSTVNRQVNRSIIARRERQDVWSIAPQSGDCDDYVMTKRHKLIGEGLPPSALRAAVVRTKGGQSHAILVVATTAGDLVLDNLRHNIMEREATGYRPVAMATANPNIWIE